MCNATPEDYLRQEAVNDLEAWKKATKFQLSTGCWIDGHWGQYGITRLIEIAVDLGFELSHYDRLAVKAYKDGKDLFYIGESACDVGDWFYGQGALADDVEDWLNENIAKPGYMFGWHDSEFFLMPIEWWQDEWYEDNEGDFDDYNDNVVPLRSMTSGKLDPHD